MSTILVTGSKGFIGSLLTSTLQSAGHQVISTDTTATRDITKESSFNEFKNIPFERVFHLAGKTSVPDSWRDPASFYHSNVEGTLRVLEFCRESNTPLTFTSAYIYGIPTQLPIKETVSPNPNNPYAHTKYLAEEMCRFYAKNFNVPSVILRLFNVYGKGQSDKFLIPFAIKQAMTSDHIRVENAFPRRDYIHVTDVVKALLLTIPIRQGFHIYNIGSGKSRSVKEILDCICRVINEPRQIIFESKQRRDEIPDTVADINLAAQELGWKPQITFEEGLMEIVNQSKENMPINKGNYSMEPPDREAAFEKARGNGWEEIYSQYRKNWSEYPKSHTVAPYPLLVDLELASICNLRCPMCYTITEEFKRKVARGLMDFTLFTKIIDEIGGKVPAIRLSLRGESTLHPQFLNCVEYAKKKGIKEVSFLTNGGSLKIELFEKMVAAGVDWITISIDGLAETFEKIRKPLKFDDMFQKIKAIHDYKKTHNLVRPVIKIQSVWPAIRNNAEEFYNTFKPYVDFVAFNPLIDYLGKDSEIAYEENFVCPQQYQRLIIGSDGLAMMCSNDEENAHVIGDANKQTIYEIWHGSELQKVRDTHLRHNGFKDISVCRKCYLPRKIDESETTVVNGRTIIIKNYVNRKQTVGE